MVSAPRESEVAGAEWRHGEKRRSVRDQLNSLRFWSRHSPRPGSTAPDMPANSLGLAFLLFIGGIAGLIAAAVASAILQRRVEILTGGAGTSRAGVLRSAALFPFACFIWAGIIWVFQATVNVVLLGRDPGLGDSWEETGRKDRHIPCTEKPAKEVRAMPSVIMRVTGYPTIMAMVILVRGFAQAQTDSAPKEGDPAPAFSITTDRGKRISPGVFGGSLLVLNFWETSCVPCVKEMPSLSDFARRFRSKHVVVVAVGADEDPQKYHRFLRDHRIALETYRDPDRRISKSFGTYMFPETYIIQDGRIIRKVVGAIDWMGHDITAFVGTRSAMIQR